MYLINSMQVSGIWQSDSVINIRVSILFQVLFSFRLLQNIGQGSLCYTYTYRSLLVTCFKDSSVYSSFPTSQSLPAHYPSPLLTISSFSKSVSMFLLCK